MFLGFHLQMGAADLACASGSMADSATRMSGMAMPGLDAPANDTSGDAPCDDHGAPAGCNLMAPCITGLFESAGQRVGPRTTHAAAPQRVITLIPDSRYFPPEPPPPRA